MSIQAVTSQGNQYQIAATSQEDNQSREFYNEKNIAHSQEIVQQNKQSSEYTSNLQDKAVIDAIKKANKKLDGGDREFEFTVHEKTKQIVVKIIDKQTHEVIREIPQEKILDMIASMCEMAGLMVDEKR